MNIVNFKLEWVLRRVLPAVVLFGYFFEYSIVADEAAKMKAFEQFTRRQQELKTQGKPPLTLSDLIDLYGNDDKREIIRRMAVSNSFFVEIRGKWELIDDPSIAVPWLMREREPLDDSALSAIERCFQKGTNEVDRLYLGAILYRYGRSRATSYLLNLLRDQKSLEAAKILALNREPDSLSSISQIIDFGIADSEFIYALGQWGDETTPMLFRGMTNTQGSRLDFIRALTMSDRRLGASQIASIRRLFQSDSEPLRVAAAGLLLRKDPGQQQYLEFLLQEVNRRSPSSVFAAWGLNQARRKEAEPVFRTILDEYLRAQGAKPFEPLHYEAVIGLTNAASSSDLQTAVRILETLPSSPNPAADGDRLGLAALIYRTGHAEYQALAAKLGGEQFNSALLRRRPPKNLPKKYLPYLSRPIEWKPYVP